MARRIPLLALAAACNGDEGDNQQSVDEYACYHIAEGTLVDAMPTRDEARTIELGYDPYRVNVISGEVRYVEFATQGATNLVLLLDYPRAVPAVWNGEERVEIPAGEPDTYCDADILEVARFSVSGSEHWLEVGPIYQGNVWLMLAPE